MIDAIEGVSGTSSVQYTPTASHANAPKSAGDTVVLSVTAQATLLQQQGFTIGEIANKLGLTASTISSDLGLPITIPLAKRAAN